eukprot:gene6605-13370_t
MGRNSAIILVVGHIMLSTYIADSKATNNIYESFPTSSSVKYTNLHKPNIILLLADDLGYGDLSLYPFTGMGIKTPEIEKLALESLTLTNFHTAAPVCTPSRAAILTGLFPWRLGIYSIYGSGPQAHEHLEVIPNLPMTLLEAGYHTAHIGKWHLGGMTPKDLKQRRDRSNDCNNSDRNNNNDNDDDRSITPGPNQHGFVEYVSMEEGQGSVRLTSLLKESSLYHTGANHLYRNDKKYTPSKNILTDRQAEEAIRVMSESVSRQKPFFLNVWFDAPHSPWEMIP